MFKLMAADADVEWKRMKSMKKKKNEINEQKHVRILLSGSIDNFTSSSTVTCTSVAAVDLTHPPCIPPEEDCLGLSPSISAACAARIKKLISESWKSEYLTLPCKSIVVGIKDCKGYLMDLLMKSIK
jgi:hypothetical protein